MEFNQTFPSNSTDSMEGTVFNCSFPFNPTFSDILSLTQNKDCYKHPTYLTVIISLFNLAILLFGWFGNFLVIYVASCKLRKRTASSCFILNLAVADFFVLMFCIPPTLLVNIFRPWVLGEIMCKCVTYAQGVSVFVSVYSLAAISLDRCQALRPNFGTTNRLTDKQSITLILAVWVFGLVIPIPWVFVFKHIDLNSLDTKPFPYCIESWPSKTYELGYFLFANMFISYLLPLLFILFCNIVIWKFVLESRKTSHVSCQRKFTVVKLFTCLTFAFFLCWLPLYLMMSRVKAFYSDSFRGSDWEKEFMAVAVPIAQLLGPVNSCLNPILYSLLNKTYRDCLLSLCCCCKSFRLVVTMRVAGSPMVTPVDRREIMQSVQNPEIGETNV